MVSSLMKLDLVGGHAIDQAMFLSNATAPATGQRESERLRLTDPFKWVGQNSCYEVEDSESNLTVSLDPVTQIVAKLT